MKQIIECVPNFSEGRDKNILDAIAKEIESTDGVKLLDVDPGAATNRTVFTIAGTPNEVSEAAFKAIRKASELIDMRKHKGEHPRMGATDICPFIPIANVSLEECIELAKQLGKRVGDELGIPVYLYEYAATSPQRKNLADIRKGEYEGLEEKMNDKNWKPDFGSSEFNAKSGVTVIGVRDFLIAYNVNLNTTDKKLANEIAFRIREQGRAKKDADGKIMKDENGETIKIPGTLKSVKAVGWVIEEYNRAQVSINLTNYHIASVHTAFEECVKEATSLGLRVTGSEIVGLIPKEAMLMAGKFYLARQGKSVGVPEKQLIEIAIQSLGLNDVSKFDPQKKIIEYVLAENKKSLNNLSVKDFADELSTDSPAPGGGSASALAGSLAAALSAMVANLTIGKKGYEQHFEELKKVSEECQKLKDELLSLVDEDTEAFNKVMDAFRLPKKTDDEKAKQQFAVEEATKYAALVPFKTMEKSFEVLKYVAIVAEKGNVNSISDAGVACLLAHSCCEGAAMNVLINVKSLSESKNKEVKKFSAKMKKNVEKLLGESRAMKQKIVRKVNGKIS
ncbi:MAG: glutamate formimidoyltransferase [Ignavibacteriales bacterium]|nr:glutamate formimidoyltransferase [Ignavibacteriales bacterium]